MGVNTVRTTTGKVTTEEIRDVEHRTSTVYQKLDKSKGTGQRVMGTTRVRPD